jgi:potassium-transporting ATPase KdpC subunit
VIRNAIRATLAVVLLAVLTGLVYPLVMTALAQVALREKADGSMVKVHDRPVGSSMIGQAWTGPGWFYGRPSAVAYDASTSSGTNLGPLSRDLANDIKETSKGIIQLESPYHPGLTVAQIPDDLLTSSGSGLDPDITPAAARFQAPRIASVHHLPLSQVMTLIDDHTSGRTLGFMGMPRVNVLELNLALDRLAAG